MWSIDRIEGEYALCENTVTGETRRIPLAELPQGAGEGALLHFTPDGWQRAEQEERARRRWLQQRSKGIGESYEEVLAAVKKRDYDDSHRAAAPLCRAEDAWLCDSTHLDFEETVAAMLAYIRQKTGAPV